MHLVFAALVVLFSSLPSFAADGRQLVLVAFERAGCPYCRKFEREVAPIYPKTEVGRSAPLRRVDLEQGPPSDVALAAPVRLTPTFVLVSRGREVGRISGYMNDAAFWGLLERMISNLPAE